VIKAAPAGDPAGREWRSGRGEDEGGGNLRGGWGREEGGEEGVELAPEEVEGGENFGLHLIAERRKETIRSRQMIS
jgi:hypothetical protein